MNSFASPQTFVDLPLHLAADDLYAQVFDAILDLRLLPGSRFTEDSLGQMFGVRRSEIRSVLTRLSHQHIIILRANHRPRVAVLDAEQTRQALHARRLTETTLLRLVCQQPVSRDLSSLRAIIEGERLCTERGQALRLSGEFHLELAALAGNAPLAHFLDSLVPLMSLAIAQFEARIDGYCDWRAHEGILDAVEGGDAVSAVCLLNRHLDHLEGLLLSPRQQRMAC
ncbi:GntR family transcriptional regulator [Pseudomonas sp. REP124]|uniref:GntR family transcriptional regulator n=1 Tax=Pseudomonas sp. REP124 TaxID=2875731 RepID=UPI001CCD8D19|nr:GntR family transcriptional regulator [Pseudomonas sp. REP124]MBZ9782105.1 GntR family transcriptional regulator [Pseudomonas sp. REP124]